MGIKNQNAFLTNKKKANKLVMAWGNTFNDFLYDNPNTGYLAMQYYPDEISASRSAEYNPTDLNFGMGSVQSWSGTSGLDIGNISTYFSRDFFDDNEMWSNDYNYDVEMIISLMYSLMIPKYEKDRIIVPPQVWFDWGVDNVFGFGGSMHQVSRFYISSVNHTVLSLFPDSKKIRAVQFDIGITETIFIDGKINVSGYANRYHQKVKSYGKSLEKAKQGNFLNYNF